MPEHTDYWLQRSEQEAISAIKAGDPKVAAIHQEMCLIYTGRALAALISRRDD